MRIRSNTMDEIFFKEGLSASANSFAPLTNQAACRQLGQNPAANQYVKPLNILLNHTVPLRMCNNWHNASRSQFKNHPFGFRNPGIVPKFQQQIPTSIEGCNPPGLNILYQTGLNNRFMTGAKAQRNVLLIKDLLQVVDALTNLCCRVLRKLIVVMGRCNSCMNAFLYQCSRQRNSFFYGLRPVIDARQNV